MKIELLPSCHGSEGVCATSYLIDETIAIDAGSVGFVGDYARQSRIRHVLLTHAHLDHLASLPMLVEGVYPAKTPVAVHGSAAVLEAIRKHLFNGVIWPDFIQMSEDPSQPPFMTVHELTDYEAVELDGYRITPVPVNHGLPTQGFLVERPEGSALMVADTGPTDDIWRVANACPNLQGVFLESSFPDSHEWLANLTHHLCPRLFAGELGKLGRPVGAVAVHIKPRYFAKVSREIVTLGRPHWIVGRAGMTFRMDQDGFRPA